MPQKARVSFLNFRAGCSKFNFSWKWSQSSSEPKMTKFTIEKEQNNSLHFLDVLVEILHDKTKFLNMGGVDLHDNTAKNEQKLQKRLLDLVHQNILARDVYDRVRPTGSQRPRMYGLPKTHKENIPLRPILSMIGIISDQNP